MELLEALTHAADRYGLDAENLINYAAEDSIGGYHPDERQRKWEIGSIWGVEGQFIYALIRATKPKLVVELGSFKGCSANHIAQALYENGKDTGDKGKLICVDYDPQFKPVPPFKSIIEIVKMDIADYLEEMPSRRVDFVFEDTFHSVETTQMAWKTATEKVKKDAFVVSHDAAHWIVGKDVRLGIAQVVENVDIYDIDPSDCGLAVWRNE